MGFGITASSVLYDTVIVDDFTRTNGVIGVAPGAFPWQNIRGTWSIASNKATTASAASGYPLAAVETLAKNVQVYTSIEAKQGVGVAFWVQDENNWWGLITDSYTTSDPYECNCVTSSYSCNCVTNYYSCNCANVPYSCNCRNVPYSCNCVTTPYNCNCTTYCTCTGCSRCGDYCYIYVSPQPCTGGGSPGTPCTTYNCWLFAGAATTSCDTCYDTVCDTCYNYVCDTCYTYTCDTCSYQTCDTCYTTTCDTCYDNRTVYTLKLLRCISGSVTTVATMDNITANGTYNIQWVRVVTSGNSVWAQPLTGLVSYPQAKEITYNAGTTGARGTKHGILVAPVSANQGNTTDTWKVMVS